MDYVIKIFREEFTGVETYLREIVDTDPEQGVYFVGNYKTHENERFTVLSEAKQRHQELLQQWKQEDKEEQERINSIKSKVNTHRPRDFTLPASYL